MRKISIVLILLSSIISVAQESEANNFDKNELKINASYTIAGIPEFTYERIINEESSFGTSLLFSTDKTNDIKFALTPFYRFYFGKKPAAGFFVEGFGMLNSIKENEYYSTYYDPNNGYIYSSTIEGEKITNFALGFSIGGKWITKKGVIFEINGGVGRNIGNSYKTEQFGYQFVPRGGLNIGYRF